MPTMESQQITMTAAELENVRRQARNDGFISGNQQMYQAGVADGLRQGQIAAALAVEKMCTDILAKYLDQLRVSIHLDVQAAIHALAVESGSITDPKEGSRPWNAAA